MSDDMTQWGPEIKVDRKRPEWLAEDRFQWQATYNVGGNDWHAPRTMPPLHWPGITAIRLPADHPYYAKSDLADTATMPPELQQRMVALVRRLAADNRRCFTDELHEARAIVADPGFPADVDEDLAEARRIASDMIGGHSPVMADAIRSGIGDGFAPTQQVLAGIRRGKQMAGGE